MRRKSRWKAFERYFPTQVSRKGIAPRTKNCYAHPEPKFRKLMNLMPRKYRSLAVSKSDILRRSLSDAYGRKRRIGKTNKKLLKPIKLLAKSAKSLKKNTVYTKDDIDFKSRFAPYIAASSYVDQSLHCDALYSTINLPSNSPNEAHNSAVNDSMITRWAQIKSKYSRFSSMVHFADIKEVQQISLKSDLWIVNFMEEAYDYSFITYNKYSARNISIEENPMCLADAFPVLLSKYIANTYRFLLYILKGFFPAC